MKNLIQLVIRFRFLVYYVFLSLICVFSIVQLRLYQGSAMLNQLWQITNSLHQKEHEFWSYFSLKEQNRLLTQQLDLKSANDWNSPHAQAQQQVVFAQTYTCIPADVVYVTTDMTHNFLTLNKGLQDGIKTDMGVFCFGGIVGRIVGASAHFSSVLPLINKESKVNCRLKKDGSYGSLGWNMEDYRFAQLSDIPLNAKIRQGDSVITSALSSIFPEGMFVGTVYYYKRNPSESFYTVKVQLSTDFKRLQHVYVLDYKFKTERDSLELKTKSVYDH